MNRIADYVKGSSLQNPFSDSQARNFSDTKMINEFCPVSNYWSLFNDQHEILLGTRGSGKTFLLKMMRYSMMKRIQDPEAQKMAEEKKFIGLYVPMYLEFVTHLTRSNISEKNQVEIFQVAFNCLLAQSLIVEIKDMLSEIDDKLECAKTNLKLTYELNNIWFDDDGDDVSDLFSLTTKLKKMFYSLDLNSNDYKEIPPVFKRQIGASLLAVKELVANRLGMAEEPTWIICIDEAEFLSVPMQRCVNSLFRSDSNRVALKVATLPYYHRTLETLNQNITVSAGNDFSYRVVDMKFDSPDFINLTNSLVVHRMSSRFDRNILISKLEDFLGEIGADDQIDYYREEVGEENSTYEKITADIIDELSETRKKSVDSYSNIRKSVYDKFAPIFYVRQMYKRSKKGNTKPGWYAGGQVIRKISQGNPRVFIQIMNDLFEKARKSELTPKVQHGIILDYVHSFCESTQALETNGPIMHRTLDLISKTLQSNVHDGILKSAGCNFLISYTSEDSFSHTKKWLEQAVAYSRLLVDEDTLKNGIKSTTEFSLANTYAAQYWIPMRSDVSPKKINITDDCDLRYTVTMPKQKILQGDQLTFWGGEE